MFKRKKYLYLMVTIISLIFSPSLSFPLTNDQITTDAANEIEPVYSFDGKRIAFVREDASFGGKIVQIINSDGSGVPINIYTPSSNILVSPSWSPDGEWVICVNQALLGFYIAKTDLDGYTNPYNQQYQLTSGEWTELYSNDWSFDGRWITFDALNSDGNRYLCIIAFAKLKLMEPELSNHIIKIENRNCCEPSWSPDGTKIVYYSADDYNIYIKEVDGDGDGMPDNTGTDISVTTDGSASGIHNTNPKWSSDGKRITYVKEDAGIKNIHACRIDGSDNEQITINDGSYDLDQPSWNLGGDRIIHHSNESTNYDIWEIDWRDDPADELAPIGYITLPASNSRVMGLVDIIGTAKDNIRASDSVVLSAMQSYTLEYRPESDPNGWTLIGDPNSVQKNDELLGTWNTGTLDEGSYVIRLTVTDGVDSIERLTALDLNRKRQVTITSFGGYYGTDKAVYSSDGSKIAVISGGGVYNPTYNVYVISSNETFIFDPYGPSGYPLGYGTSAAWSPDGTKLAVANGNIDIYTFVEATGQWQIGNTIDVGGFCEYIDVSPDGEYFIINGVQIIKSDGTGDSIDFNLGANAKWSPDGTKIVYDNGSNIFFRFIDGNGDGIPDDQGAVTQVTTDGGTIIFESQLIVNQQPGWSSDGEKVIYSSNRLGSYELWVSLPDLSIERITFEDDFWIISGNPCFSPTGERIVYTEWDVNSYTFDIFEIDYKKVGDPTAAPRANIIEPLNGQILSGDIVIKGTAADNISIDGVNVLSEMTSYTLSYGEGENPSSYTEIFNSSNKIENNTLIVWDTSNIISKGVYRLKLEATDGTDTAEDCVLVTLDGPTPVLYNTSSSSQAPEQPFPS